MKFHIVEGGFLCEKNLGFSAESQALFYDTKTPVVCFSSVLLNDLELLVDYEGRVLFAQGYFPETSWVEAPVNVPECVEGSLVMNSESLSLFQEGVSKMLSGQSLWDVHRDLDSGWFYIFLKDNDYDCVVNFAKNHMAALDVDGSLVALWVKPEFRP